MSDSIKDNTNINFEDEFNNNKQNVADAFFTVKINNEYIQFKNTHAIGTTSIYFKDDDNKYFLKIPKLYNDYSILKREVFILNKLSKYEKHFPKLIAYTDYYIITEYIGDILSSENMPNDILNQTNDIINILKKEDIVHCDIKMKSY